MVNIKQISKLSWIINNACNLRCIHCYPNSGVENKREFTDHDFKKILHNLEGMHFKKVFLSGGEPLLDKQFNTYLKISKEIGDEVFICSNGTLLTDDKISELVDAGVNGIVLSCQAIDRQTALKIYGNPQVPRQVFNAIERIQKQNIVLSMEVSLMKQNVCYIDEIIEHLISYGIKSLSFKRLLPVGRGSSIEVGLSKDENFSILKKIYNWQVLYENIRFNVHDPLYGTILFDHLKKYSDGDAMLKWLQGFSCRAGTRWIGIDPAGNVSPCPILLYKDTIIGNLFDAPLVDILSNSFLIELFQKVDAESNTCCKYGNFCLGCRATAIAKSGDLFSRDPMCVYEGDICPISMKCESKK